MVKKALFLIILIGAFLSAVELNSVNKPTQAQTSGNFCASSTYSFSTSCGTILSNPDGNSYGDVIYKAPNVSTTTKCTVNVDRGNVDCSINSSTSTLSSGATASLKYEPICDDTYAGCKYTFTINPPASSQSTTATPSPTPVPVQTTAPVYHAPQATPTQTVTTTNSTTQGQGGSLTGPASVSPEVLYPKGGEVFTGTKQVEIKASEYSSVDLQLQVNEDNLGTLHLGRVYVEAGKNSAIYNWDTKNTPNGEYSLFALVNKTGTSQIILGPIQIKVDNSLSIVQTQSAYQALLKKIIELSKSSTNQQSTEVVPEQTTENNQPEVTEEIIRTEERELAELEAEVGDLGIEDDEGLLTEEEFLNENVVSATVKDIVFSNEEEIEEIEEKEEVKVTKIENTRLENSNLALTFSGVADPHKIITLAIFSNPIVVTVKTDKNGLWTYSLEKPLAPGKHSAYVLVPSGEGDKQIRSSVAEFVISPAVAASTGNESLVLQSSDYNEPLYRFAIATGVIIASFIIVLLIFYKLRKERQASEDVAV